MRIRTIHLDDNEQPATLLAELTRSEAVFLVKLLGRMNGVQGDDVMPGGSEAGSDIYDSLNQMFVKFWENGVDDV